MVALASALQCLIMSLASFRSPEEVFDDVAVRRILTNPVYCAVDDLSIAFFEERKCEVIAAKGGSGDIGFMPYNRTNQQRELQTMDKWFVSAGAHKPLISSENWIRVQKILEGNSAEYAKYAHRKKTDCKVVWNGERLEVFQVTSTSGGTEITDEVISAPEKPVAEPPRPEETDGYSEFRKCSDLVVRAFAKSHNISLRQLAKKLRRFLYHNKILDKQAEQPLTRTV